MINAQGNQKSILRVFVITVRMKSSESVNQLCFKREKSIINKILYFAACAYQLFLVFLQLIYSVLYKNQNNKT